MTLRKEAEELLLFKGKSALVKRIDSSIDFIKNYRGTETLGKMMLAERQDEVAQATKEVQQRNERREQHAST